MSEKLREEFEKWASELLLPMDKVGGSYVHTGVNRRWQAWQASRSALVVELPSDINGEYYADGWNAALMCVEERLKEAGVSYK